MLPDRLLVYADDGDDGGRGGARAAASQPLSVAGAPVHPRGRVPPPHRPDAGGLTGLRSPTSRRRLPPAATRLACGRSVLAHGLPPHLAGQHRLALPLAAAVPARHGARAWAAWWTARPGGVDGVRYLQFVAPGMLAAQAMWVAIGESTYQVLGGIKWNRSTTRCSPRRIGVRDILVGHLAYVRRPDRRRDRDLHGRVGRRSGRSPSWWVLLCLPVAVLVGLAFAVPIFAFSATQESDGGFNILFRFVIIPLFLFSGTFFPIAQLPAVLRPVAWLTPLWHGVDAQPRAGRWGHRISRGSGRAPAGPARVRRRLGGSRCARSAAGWSSDDPHAAAGRTERSRGPSPALPVPAGAGLARILVERNVLASTGTAGSCSSSGFSRAGLLPVLDRHRLGALVGDVDHRRGPVGPTPRSWRRRCWRPRR